MQKTIFFCFYLSATALNSYFDFVDQLPIRYVNIQKTFPKLIEFTISFWLKLNLKLSKDSTTRTVFTYSFGENLNALRFKIGESTLQNSLITKKLNIQIEILNQDCILTIQYSYNQKHKWIHFGITWKKQGRVSKEK